MVVINSTGLLYAALPCTQSSKDEFRSSPCKQNCFRFKLVPQGLILGVSTYAYLSYCTRVIALALAAFRGHGMNHHMYMIRTAMPSRFMYGLQGL